MARRRSVTKVPVAALEFGDEFQLAGKTYRILEVAVGKTVTIEFVPTDDVFATSNVMDLQPQIMFLRFGDWFEV